MSKRLTSGIVAAIVALGMSVPAVSFANKGGTPNSHASTHATGSSHSKACQHTPKGKAKRTRPHGTGKGKAGTKGKHCGI